MIGSTTRWWVLGVALVMAAPAFAQSPSGFGMQSVAAKYVAPQGELRGVIHDERGQPLPNAIIAAAGLGSSSTFVTSDREGRFAFRSLRPGGYLVRAYLAGYSSPRDSYVQVIAGARQVSDIALNK